MQKLILRDGNKEHEYLLDLSFNAIVDTDAMEEMQRAEKIVKSISVYEKAKQLAQKSAKGKEVKLPKELEDFNEQTQIKEFFGIVRSLLLCCLSDNHEDEFSNEKEVGKLIGKLIKQPEYDLFKIFDIIGECIEECDFFSETPTTEDQQTSE